MKKILIAFFAGILLLTACSNEDERELELVYVYEHSYKYEDMVIKGYSSQTDVQYGPEIDGKLFTSDRDVKYPGYELTKEIYDLIKNATLILYINDIKIETRRLEDRWVCDLQKEELIFLVLQDLWTKL